MKTLHPVDEETYARIGKAYLICSQHPDVFGEVRLSKFCGMFVDDIIEEGEYEHEARIRAAGPEMYALLQAAFGGTISLTEIIRLGGIARDLLARIDGKEESRDEE